MLLGLRTTIYPAADLAAAKAWWTARLGFGPYFDEPFYVGFEVGGYELGLNPRADPARGTRSYWGVADCRAAYESMLAAGAAEADEPPAEVGEGIIVASVTGPGGEHIGLIENPHFPASTD